MVKGEDRMARRLRKLLVLFTVALALVSPCWSPDDPQASPA
jgi:hypothetical protein